MRCVDEWSDGEGVGERIEGPIDASPRSAAKVGGEPTVFVCA